MSSNQTISIPFYPELYLESDSGGTRLLVDAPLGVSERRFFLKSLYLAILIGLGSDRQAFELIIAQTYIADGYLIEKKAEYFGSPHHLLEVTLECSNCYPTLQAGRVVDIIIPGRLITDFEAASGTITLIEESTL